MKKFSLILFSVIIFVSIFSFSVFADQDVSLYLNNEKVEPGTPPVFKNQRTMVTLDFFEKAGVITVFDRETEKITLDGEYSSVEFTIGEEIALIHRKFDFTGISERIELDVAPFILDGMVYVPLRFAAESLGALVEWNAVDKSVLVSFEKGTDIIPVERPVEYEEIDISEPSDEDGLYEWVQENRISKGIYHKSINGKNYILICAGEKPTGGYSIEIRSITQVSPGRIYMDAEVIEPSPDTMVIQIITYPCRLIVIDSDGEISVDGDINDNAVTNNEELSFETVNPDIVASNEELSAWIQQVHTEAGIHSKQIGEHVYVVAAAGQKNTGGYSVIVEKVTREHSGDVYVHAVVESPDPDMMVIQVITWPYTVIRLEGTGSGNVHGEIQNSAPANKIINFE